MTRQAPEPGAKNSVQSSAGKRSELGLRVVSALVLLAITLAITLYGGPAFQIFCAFGAALILLEYAGIVFGNFRHPAHWRLYFCLLAVVAVFFLWGAYGAAIALAAMSIALAIAGRFTGRGYWDAAGLAYASLPFLAMVLLRGEDSGGIHAVFFLFACVWGADTLAYFAGRAIGGPKLAPAISPNKTWSGFAGGMAGSVLIGLAVVWIAGYTPAFGLAALALLLGLASVAGDLFESWLKRKFGKKDSGNTIPGHGGVLDRLDGLIFAAVIFWIAGIVSGAPAFDPGAVGETLLGAFLSP